MKKEDGIPIIAFMKTGKSDENYYKAIETYLGVKKKI